MIKYDAASVSAAIIEITLSIVLCEGLQICARVLVNA